MKRPRRARRTLAVLTCTGALASGMILPVLATTAAAATAGGLGPPNTFVATAPLGVAQSGQTATLLPDGQVLIAAGGTTNAELYNPATRSFAPTAKMPLAVSGATATLLPNGKVLVAGGVHGFHQVTSAELYNPATGTWAATGAMNVARSGQTATLLPDGQVLVAGGGCNGHAYGCDAGSFEAALSSAELYNPATGTWARTGSMKSGREYFTATLLKNGQVLAAGGFNNCDDDFCSDVATADLYNPATGTWTQTGSMQGAREQHSATLLPDGDVLVAGGLNEGGFCCSQFEYSSAELYNPATGTWTPTASMAVKHAGQTATLLPGGWVLVAGGGTPVAEIYEPGPGIWVSPGAMSTTRTHQTATLLPNGRVLMAGGDGPDGQPLSTAEEFLAGNGPLVTVTPGSIAFGGQLVGTVSAAHFYKITNVGTAGLVVTGATVSGKNPGDFRVHTGCAGAPVPPGGTCTVAVRFAPSSTSLRTAAISVSDNAPLSPQGVPVTGFGGGPDAWTPVGPMISAREHFTATLLPGGKVLMAGGQTVTGSSLASAELYNPATRSFSATGSLHTARSYPAAALLPDGKVLVTGGLSDNFISLSSAELYNPAAGTWANTTPMNAPGYGLTATPLPSGSVLVTGFGVDNSRRGVQPGQGDLDQYRAVGGVTGRLRHRHAAGRRPGAGGRRWHRGRPAVQPGHERLEGDRLDEHRQAGRGRRAAARRGRPCHRRERPRRGGRAGQRGAVRPGHRQVEHHRVDERRQVRRDRHRAARWHGAGRRRVQLVRQPARVVQHRGLQQRLLVPGALDDTAPGVPDGHAAARRQRPGRRRRPDLLRRGGRHRRGVHPGRDVGEPGQRPGGHPGHHHRQRPLRRRDGDVVLGRHHRPGPCQDHQRPAASARRSRSPRPRPGRTSSTRVAGAASPGRTPHSP